MLTNKSAAESILENTKQLYSGPHCYRLVDAARFSHLDLKFYENALRELEAEGFRHAGDVENLTVKEGLMDPRTFLRMGLSADGTITSTFYQMKPNIWWRLLFWLTRCTLGKNTDFETEFDDGSFVTTSNAKMAEALDRPPLIFAEFQSEETSALALLESHRKRVREHAETRNARPRTCYSLQDILDSQHRMETIKSEFRERVGWLKKSEWDRLAAPANDHSDEIYDEFVELQKEN